MKKQIIRLVKLGDFCLPELEKAIHEMNERSFVSMSIDPGYIALGAPDYKIGNFIEEYSFKYLCELMDGYRYECNVSSETILIGLINYQIEMNYFSFSNNEKKCSVISIFNVEELVGPDAIKKYLTTGLAEHIVVHSENHLWHPEPKRCLFDFCGDRRNISSLLSNYALCDDCNRKISDSSKELLKLSFDVWGQVESDGDTDKTIIVKELHSTFSRTSAVNNRKEETLMKTDVAVLTALTKELDAFLRHIPSWEKVRNSETSNRTYYRSVNKAGISVVAACAAGMGQLNAALLVQEVINTWSPKKIILVGIAGGLQGEVNLGDIVISDQIVDYEIGKVTPEKLSPRWSVYQSDPGLRDSFLNFRTNDWLSRIAEKRPSDPKKTPRIHSGVVLSGNKVIADEATAGALRSVWTRAAAIEMESAGIAAALHQIPNSPSFIMVKGICDFADSNKNDNWQEYAADVASAFIIAFIEEELQPRDARPINEKTPEIAIPNHPGIDFRAIRLALSSAFDLRELKVLVSDLGVDWDEIPGDTKSTKIVELMWYLKRRRRLNSLFDLVNEDRDNLLDAYILS